MKLALYGILVILALFVVLMVFNPNLSCFGRKLKSPLYPVLRKKKRKQKMMKTVDYGFDLGGPGEKKSRVTSTKKPPQQKRTPRRQNIETENYGFDLSGRSRDEKQ